MNERLMMSEEKCRKKVKELLQIPKEDLLTKYMFQEQEIERLNNKIKEQNLLLIEFQDIEQKVNIYKSRCKRANKIITDFMCTEEYCNVDPVAIAENYMEIQKSLNGSDKNE